MYLIIRINKLIYWCCFIDKTKTKQGFFDLCRFNFRIFNPIIPQPKRNRSKLNVGLVILIPFSQIKTVCQITSVLLYDINQEQVFLKYAISNYLTEMMNGNYLMQKYKLLSTRL